MRTRMLLAALLAASLSACSGEDGSNGIDGVDGDEGPEGPAGEDGVDGDDGAPGTDGTDGTNGTNGTDGTNGNNGTDGDDGAPGDQGPTGDAGTPGEDGDDGDDGLDGDNIILSESARLGLSISPVEVDLDGLDGDGIESVGRGSYLVNAVGDCVGCHSGTGPLGEPLFLAGNADFPIGGFDASGVPCTIGTVGCIDSHVFTRNLTPHATTGMLLTEDQFVEALRTGRDFKDATGGTTLIVMPWAQLRWMTDRDLRDMYRYLKSIPAIDNPVQSDVKPVFPPPPSPFFDGAGDPVGVPEFQDGAVDRSLPAAFDLTLGEPTAAAAEAFDDGNVLRGLAISPLDDDAVVAGLSPADQALYGRGSYIVNGPGLCNECHTAGGRNLDGTVRVATFLAGGQAFAVPPPLQAIIGQVRTMSANLTGDNEGFDLPFNAFVSTLVSGMSFTKDEPHVLGFPMPADMFRNMTTEDKLAVYTYIATIKSAGLVDGDTEHQAPARFCTTMTDCEAGETCEAVTVLGAPTHTCASGPCVEDADCGACQTCDIGVTDTCLVEDAASACVLSSF